MAILVLEDILKKVGLDPARVGLIRHSLKHSKFKACYDKGMVKEYTAHQKIGFGKDYDYWIVFISDDGTLARLHSCYKSGPSKPDVLEIAPTGLPEEEVASYQGERAYFDLQYTDILAEYENRLVIDWGKSTRMWQQRGTIEKPIFAIQMVKKMVFSGFEDLTLTYDELKAIIENKLTYESWYTALSSVYAVYVIADKVTGQLYVGSAYGQEGLWGRWADYVATGHGGNEKMKTLLVSSPERYLQFQFSVLQIFPKTVSENEITYIEKLYKRKLLSIPWGLNDN